VRAADAADWIRVTVGGDVRVAGTGNVEAAARSGVVVLAVPYDVHDELVHELSPHLTGRVIVTLREPAGLRRVEPCGLPVAGGSIVEVTAAALSDARVVGAFHHLSAVSLGRLMHDLSEEAVMVCGGGDAACDLVARLASDVTGSPPW